jgi:hypothetical protein
MYGARGTRTPDLLGAIQALSQLSYSPTQRRRDKCSDPSGTGSAHGTAPGARSSTAETLVRMDARVGATDKGSGCTRYGWRSMGLLDDAIREHLEFKRLRGADPSKVAIEAQEALCFTSRGEETESLDEPDDLKGPATRGETPPLGETESISQPDRSNMGQETMELDMRTVLHEGSLEQTRGPELLPPTPGPSSTPSPASLDHPAARVGRGDLSAGNPWRISPRLDTP